MDQDFAVPALSNAGQQQSWASLDLQPAQFRDLPRAQALVPEALLCLALRVVQAELPSRLCPEPGAEPRCGPFRLTCP